MKNIGCTSCKGPNWVKAHEIAWRKQCVKCYVKEQPKITSLVEKRPINTSIIIRKGSTWKEPIFDEKCVFCKEWCVGKGCAKRYNHLVVAVKYSSLELPACYPCTEKHLGDQTDGPVKVNGTTLHIDNISIVNE